MSIAVKNEALQRCEAEYKKLSQKLSQIENSLQTIRKSLDSDIKHERNIDKDFKEVCEDVDQNERSLRDIAKFLSNTVKAYEGAEKNIEKDLNKLSQKKSGTNIFSDIFDKLSSIRKKAEAILKILIGFGIFGAPIGTIITLNEIKKYYAEKGITVNNKEEKPIEIKKADIPELKGILSYDPSKYKEEVLLLQKKLNECDFIKEKLVEDGLFGKKTLAAVNKYKEHYGLWNFGEYEGKVGKTTWEHLFTNNNKPAIKIPLEVKENDDISNVHPANIESTVKPCSSINEFKSRYGDLINEYAKKLGVDEAVLGAIVFTESGGGGFYKNGTLKIRFEDHIFTGKLGSGKFKEYFIHDSKDYSKESYRTSLEGKWLQIHTPGKQELSEYGAFEFAKTLDEDAAYNSVSMGFGQIMGFNYKVLGYKSSKEMFIDFSKSEKQQIIGMMKFIENYSPKMLKALQNNDLGAFGSYYNGSSNYGNKVKNNINVYRNAQIVESNENHTKQEVKIKSDETEKGLITNSQYNMVDTKTWNVTVPKYVYKSGQRNRDTYNLLINQFEVGSNKRYVPRNGNTYCNIFAWDVSVAMGVELPRFVEVNQKGNIEDATGKAIGRNLSKGYVLYEDPQNATATELNANRLATWLEAQGASEGWREVTPEEAQERANKGYMTISVIKKPKIGHVQVVRPTPDGSLYNEKKGVFIAQAGSNNFNGAYYFDKCRSADYEQYKFYTHD